MTTYPRSSSASWFVSRKQCAHPCSTGGVWIWTPGAVNLRLDNIDSTKITDLLFLQDELTEDFLDAYEVHAPGVLDQRGFRSGRALRSSPAGELTECIFRRGESVCQRAARWSTKSLLEGVRAMNIDRYKNDLDALIAKGTGLYHAMIYECAPQRK